MLALTTFPLGSLREHCAAGCFEPHLIHTHVFKLARGAHLSRMKTPTSAFWKGLRTGTHWSLVQRKRKISYRFKPKFPMDGIPGILFRGWLPDETKMFVTVNPFTWFGCNSAKNFAYTSSTPASVGSLFFGLSSNKGIKGGKPPFQSTRRQAHPFSNVQGCLKGYNHGQKS